MKGSVEIKVLCEEESGLPGYSSPEAAGADIRARLDCDLVLQHGATALIPTGLRLEIPAGFELQIRPRSGLALKHGITVLNTPGTVDSDFRGEVGVILINHGSEPFVVQNGMRIAQIVLAPVTRAHFIRVEQPLKASSRGSGGFGHTGLN